MIFQRKETEASRPSASEIAIDLSVIATALVLGFLVVSRFVDLHTLFVKGLNDQAGYVTTARWLLDTGQLRSSIIYPSTLWQQKPLDVPIYMPGYYGLLTAAFALCGYSVMTAVGTSLFCLAGGALLLYLLTLRLYDRPTARLSVAIWCLFPPHALYGFSAMSEMAVATAVLLALTAIVWLPPRLRAGSAALLAIPLLFRETTIVMMMPLTGFFASATRPSSARETRAALGFSVAAIAVFLAVLWSPLAAQRPSLFRANLFDPRFTTVYTDAVAQRNLTVSKPPLLPAMATRLGVNLLSLKNMLLHGEPAETFALIALLTTIPIGLFLGWRGRDGWLTGSAAAVLVLLGTDLLLYDVSQMRGVRFLLQGACLMAISWARLLRGVPIARPLAIGGLLGVLLLMSCSAMVWIHAEEPALNASAALDTRFVESLAHDDRTVLVAPASISLDYVVRHYPVQWSFMPANRETLALLSSRHRVGTILLPDETPRDPRLTAGDLSSMGFVPVQRVTHDGRSFIVFRHPERE